jgi:protein TonB
MYGDGGIAQDAAAALFLFDEAGEQSNALAVKNLAAMNEQGSAAKSGVAAITASPADVAPPATNALPSSMPPIRRNARPLAGESPPYPREAIRAGISKGRVVARLSIDEQGNVSELIIVASDPPKVFDRTVIDTLKMWKFPADGTKYVTEVDTKFEVKSK